MNNLSVFKFEESKEVRTLTDERDGSAWFVLKDVCKVLDIANSGNASARLDDDEKGVHTMDTLGGNQQSVIINESGLYSLILSSRKPEAKRFKKWVTSEVIPSIRKTGSYSVPQVKAMTPAELLEGAEVIARVLNLTGSSLAGAMKRTVKASYPALLPMIPDYSIDAPVIAGQAGATSAEPCFSITELLKRHNAPIGAVTANKRLIDLGLLEEKERPSVNGKSKKFKCVTKSGLKYGKNVVSDQNPRETQPQWFESTFADLFGLIA